MKDKLRTEICDLLNIRYPIIQGGMAWAATAELVSTVSNAGGLGILGAGGIFDPLILKEEIRKTRNLTKKPFGVNIVMGRPGDEILFKVIIEEEVQVVTTGAGNPSKYINDLHQKGIKIIPVVSSVDVAKKMEKSGVDAIIAEGMESAGHIGEIATLVLIPQVVETLKIPVIAAGGIADGRGTAAALALGAKGVQMGTRFLCSKECTAHENYKKMIVKAKDRCTIVNNYAINRPYRMLKNELAEKLKKLNEEKNIPEIVKLNYRGLKRAVVEGDMEMGSFACGQCAGLINKVESVSDIIKNTVKEAEKIIKSLNRLI